MAGGLIAGNGAGECPIGGVGGKLERRGDIEENACGMQYSGCGEGVVAGSGVMAEN